MADNPMKCPRCGSESVQQLDYSLNGETHACYDCWNPALRWREPDLVFLRAENARLAGEVERYRTALNDIASWREGPEVTGKFDEPGSAAAARQALTPPAAPQGETK